MAFRDAFGRFAAPITDIGVLGSITALAEATVQSTEVKRALQSIGETVVATIELLMEQSGDPPSLPGQAPAIRTGQLHDSYRYVVENGKDGLELAVGSNLQYAGFLEFGTVNMLPRPHLAPAMDIGAQEAHAKIGDAIVVAERTALSAMPKVIYIE